MFSRPSRPSIGHGAGVVRRAKRVKTYHNARDGMITAEDEVFREFQDILGHLRGGGDISGSPDVEYDEIAKVDEANGTGSQELAEYPDDSLPEANLKKVPHDPSLQALWIAREIKRLAIYNEQHSSNVQVKSHSVIPTLSDIEAPDQVNGAHGNASSSFPGSWRSSGRKRRRTDKAKDSHSMDANNDSNLSKIVVPKRNPLEGLEMMSALVTNERIHHALIHSLNLGPGNFERRNFFGILFLQSMAADTLPPNPNPAAELKHALWRSRTPVPIISALHILAGFSEVCEAIDIAFQGRLDWRTPPSQRQPFSDVINPVNRSRGGVDLLHNGSSSGIEASSSRNNWNSFVSPSSVDQQIPRGPDLSTPFTSEGFPRLLPKITNSAIVPPPHLREAVVESTPLEYDLNDSFDLSPGAPMHVTVIDPARSARSVTALKAATEILDDMAYGAVKNLLLPSANGPPNNQYMTPYGVPAPNTYVTPYGNPSQGSPPQAPPQAPPQGSPSQRAPSQVPPPQSPNHQFIYQPAAFEHPIVASQTPRVSAGEGFQAYEGPSSATRNPQEREGIAVRSKVKGKEKEQEPLPPTKSVAKLSKRSKDAGAMATSKAVNSNQHGQDDDEDFTQIDSFLALAAGSDSDSDDEIDRDRTISREMTPLVSSPGDLAVDSVVQGVIFELATNQNRGHGLGFLNPQTHLYQINNAQRFAEGLKENLNNANLELNCVISAKHGRAQSAFYDAVIKRITNPFLEGSMPQYSNIVYHKGKAYQAIPGPAHPMFHQQMPFPPPSLPSSEMVLSSQNSPPAPGTFPPPPGMMGFPGPFPFPAPVPGPGPIPFTGPAPPPGLQLPPPPPFPLPPPPPHGMPVPPPGPGPVPPPGFFPPPGFLPPPGMMPMKLPIDPLRRVSIGKGPTRRVRTYKFKSAKSRSSSAPFESGSVLQGFQPSAFQRPVFFPANDGLNGSQPPPGPRKRKRKLQLTASDLASDRVESAGPSG